MFTFTSVVLHAHAMHMSSFFLHLCNLLRESNNFLFEIVSSSAHKFDPFIVISYRRIEKINIERDGALEAYKMFAWVCLCFSQQQKNERNNVNMLIRSNEW